MARPVVILGIFVADATYHATRLPSMGETLLGSTFVTGPGGNGSNQAVAAARAGTEAQFLTRLGRDAIADMAREIWGRAGTFRVVVEDAESDTGSAFIFLEATSGENAIIVCPDAAERITAADVEARWALTAGAGVFVTQLQQPLASARHGLAIARTAGVTTIPNPASAHHWQTTFSFCATTSRRTRSTPRR